MPSFNFKFKEKLILETCVEEKPNELIQSQDKVKVIAANNSFAESATPSIVPLRPSNVPVRPQQEIIDFINQINQDNNSDSSSPREGCSIEMSALSISDV